MFELLRIFWLPLGLTAGILARVPFGTAWFGVLSLFVLGLGIGVGIQWGMAQLADPELGEDPDFPLGDYWIYTLAALAIGAIVIDAAIFAAPLTGVLAGRFGYLTYG